MEFFNRNFLLAFITVFMLFRDCHLTHVDKCIRDIKSEHGGDNFQDIKARITYTLLHKLMASFTTAYGQIYFYQVYAIIKAGPDTKDPILFCNTEHTDEKDQNRCKSELALHGITTDDIDEAVDFVYMKLKVISANEKDNFTKYMIHISETFVFDEMRTPEEFCNEELKLTKETCVESLNHSFEEKTEAKDIVEFCLIRSASQHNEIFSSLLATVYADYFGLNIFPDLPMKSPNDFCKEDQSDKYKRCLSELEPFGFYVETTALFALRHSMYSPMIRNYMGKDYQILAKYLAHISNHFTVAHKTMNTTEFCDAFIDEKVELLAYKIER